MDSLTICRDLIAFKSITPNEAGCFDYIEKLLSNLIHKKFRYKNALHLQIGSSNKKFCFLGHVDVVPVCNNWSSDPFLALIKDDFVFGRGVSDMKGSVSAFLSSVLDIKDFDFEIHIILTSDEEGDSNGIKEITPHLPKFDFILVGEPSNPKTLGEMIKIGRRGSLNGVIEVKGKGGHIAYPNDAISPIPKLLKGLIDLLSLKLDNESSIQISSIETDTKTSNVIPSIAKACFNIRFAEENILEKLEPFFKEYDVDFNISALPFLTKLTNYHEILRECIFTVTKTSSTFSSTGGTSEARFLKDFGPVAEFGLISDQAHKVNERVKIKDIIDLKKIYSLFLKNFVN